MAEEDSLLKDFIEESREHLATIEADLLRILEDRGEPYGFLVDSVSGAIALDGDNLEAPPASLDTALRGRLLGIWREPDHLTAILDPATLFLWDATARKA